MLVFLPYFFPAKACFWPLCPHLCCPKAVAYTVGTLLLLLELLLLATWASGDPRL
eukprot:30801_1